MSIPSDQSEALQPRSSSPFHSLTHAPMEFILADGKSLDPDCSTLVVPAISIGNVGQLAVELLISSVGAEKVGYLDDPSVLPCVGNNAYSPVPEGDLALAHEVYQAPSKSISLIQQRSPNLKGMLIEYGKRLAEFVATNGMNHIVVLSSLDSGRRKIIDASGTQVYYMASSSTDGTNDDCENLGWERLEQYNPSQKCWQYLYSLAEGNSMQDEFLDEDDMAEDDYYARLPFAALFSCCKAKGLKVTCIFCYCSEGDNLVDSFQLAAAASRFLGLGLDKVDDNGNSGWILPFSLKTVYGPPPDISLF